MPALLKKTLFAKMLFGSLFLLLTAMYGCNSNSKNTSTPVDSTSSMKTGDSVMQSPDSSAMKMKDSSSMKTGADTTKGGQPTPTGH